MSLKVSALVDLVIDRPLTAKALLVYARTFWAFVVSFLEIRYSTPRASASSDWTLSPRPSMNHACDPLWTSSLLSIPDEILLAAVK